MDKIEIPSRGAISPAIQQRWQEFFGTEVTVRGLRLLPYIDYVMKNDRRLDPNHINQEEREILSAWRKTGHVDGGASGMSVTKEFYDFMQEILWLGYVNYDDIALEQAVSNA